eukprot:6200334-Pleurochrysis_carterae.AAC.1
MVPLIVRVAAAVRDASASFCAAARTAMFRYPGVSSSFNPRRPHALEAGPCETVAWPASHHWHRHNTV